MKEFLLLFWNVSGDGNYQMDPDKMEENMIAWQSWIGQIAATGNLISTKPINWEGIQVSNQGKQSGPVIKQNEMVTGYMLCQASNLEQVEEWAANCPILLHPNGYTEIREVAPFEL